MHAVSYVSPEHMDKHIKDEWWVTSLSLPKGNMAGDIDKCTPDKIYTITQSQVNKAQHTKPLISDCVNNNPYSQQGTAEGP